MLDELKAQLNGYALRKIARPDFRQVFEVYDANQDFFILTDGKPTTMETSINDTEAVPPGCDISQKIYLGIWMDNKPIAVLDMITGYPTPSHIYIGLLLVHSDFHGKRIGSEILDAILRASKVADYEAVQLGVIDSNTKGIKFWHSHGFETIRIAGNVVVMEKQIKSTQRNHHMDNIEKEAT